MAGFNHDQLKRCWNQLACQYCHDSQLIDTIFEDITHYYNETHRHYHTLEHLHCLFQDLAKPSAELDDESKTVVMFSTWFHDLVYQPGKKNNEALSAEVSIQKLTRLGVNHSIIDRVNHTILCTVQHEDPTHQFCTELFLDADMAILGKSPSDYAEYADNVRQEFSHIPNIVYKMGRKNFLRSTLEKSRIYYTDYFSNFLEKSALQNIAAEIDTL